MKVLVKAEKGAKIPVFKTEGSAGADVSAFLPLSPITLKAGEIVSVATGLKLEIPPGYEIQVRPRSGLALKNGITVLNSPGTIDSDYRGEVRIILVNLSKNDFVINDGDRICQFVLSPVIKTEYVQTSELSETERNEGGFGSTGV